TQNVLREKAGLSDGEKSEPVFYVNSDPSVLNDILGNKYKVIEKDF
ncbi:glutamate racemase, partial [Flavobacterium circumlabens]